MCPVLLPTCMPRTALSPGNTPNNKPFGVDIRGERENCRKSIYPDNSPAAPSAGNCAIPKGETHGQQSLGLPNATDPALDSLLRGPSLPRAMDGGPYREACCNLEVLVLGLAQGQGQCRGQVLLQTQRVEVVWAPAAASQASAACPALPSAGGQAGAVPWPASYRP